MISSFHLSRPLHCYIAKKLYIGSMIEKLDQIKALASPLRMEVLRVLDKPNENFAHQESADPAKVGVCMNMIAEHFSVSQPTMSRHLDLLKRANFISTVKQQKWTYCLRNEKALADYADWMRQSLNVKPPG
jgi:DNA-binding transcriptional ArsR family regulator